MDIAASRISCNNATGGILVLGNFGVDKFYILATAVQNAEEASIALVAALKVGNGMIVPIEVNFASVRAGSIDSLPISYGGGIYVRNQFEIHLAAVDQGPVHVVKLFCLCNEVWIGFSTAAAGKDDGHDAFRELECTYVAGLEVGAGRKRRSRSHPRR